MKEDLLFYSAYEQFYEMAEKSNSFKVFCKDAFGEDFSQDGFSDINQINMIFDYLPDIKNLKILDVGCGNGKMLGYLQKKTNAHISGFDYSEKAISCAKNLFKNNADFRVGIIGEIEYPDNSFDFITSMDTMYFARDMVSFITQIKRWLKPDGVLFVGYQAVNSLGRKIYDGAPSVKLFNETIDVEAEILHLDGISGDADNNGLLRWVEAIQNKPQKVFVVHGDDDAVNDFTQQLVDRGFDATSPYSGAVYDLEKDCYEIVADPVAITKKSAETARADSVFSKLVAAGKRLAAVIQRNKGGANKDLAKFTSQIEALCDKWDR